MLEILMAMGDLLEPSRILAAAVVALMGYPLYRITEWCGTHAWRKMQEWQRVKINALIPDVGEVVRGVNEWAVESDVGAAREIGKSAAGELKRLEEVEEKLYRVRQNLDPRERRLLAERVSRASLLLNTCRYAVRVVDPEAPGREIAAQNLANYLQRVQDVRPTARMFKVALQNVGDDSEAMQYQLLRAAKGNLSQGEWNGLIATLSASGAQLAPASRRFVETLG